MQWLLLIMELVHLVDAHLGGLRYLLLTASTTLQTQFAVLGVVVAGLLHCRDRTVRLGLKAS